MHPSWYYKEYERVFAPARDYEREVAIIDSIQSLKGRVVEEVGAGTGNHLSCVLKYGPSRLIGVDLDPKAVEILRKRFSAVCSVEIVRDDGLARDAPADVVFCYYCLPQQVCDSALALKRLMSIASRARRGCGIVFVEWMDVALHLLANKNAAPSLVFADGSDFLEISSEETDYGVLIRYTGFLVGNEARYEAPIARLPIDVVKSVCDSEGISLNSQFLSSSSRRALLSFSCSA